MWVFIYGVGIRDCLVVLWFVFFFFKKKTAYEIISCYWSSDVGSSVLRRAFGFVSRFPTKSYL
jgi:hypothetical protein